MTTLVTEAERAAVERLFWYAQDDTEQSKRVASFLLAWWWSQRCGGFNIDEALHLSHDIRSDIVIAMAVAIQSNVSPEYLGHKLEHLVRKWRRDVAMELDEECAVA